MWTRNLMISFVAFGKGRIACAEVALVSCILHSWWVGVHTTRRGPKKETRQGPRRY